MSRPQSLSDRVGKLRELRRGKGPTGIIAGESVAGDWGPGTRAFPASFAQSRLWILHQLEPGLTAYHMPALWRLSGDLDLNALQRAFSDLIERHPTLRTSFRLHGSDVLQVIHPPAAFHLEAEVLGDRDPDAVVERWLDQENSTPFDLTAGLLLRARLLTVDAQRHLLLINHHHIASDGWSRSLLTRDLTELYNAHRNGRPPELPALSVHYQDYAVWQRHRMSGNYPEALTDYWIPQLTDLEPLEIPGDRPRPATFSYTGDSISFRIGPELLAPFERLCRAEGATLQMGLLALLSLLLHRYSRQDDVAVGIPIWGRNHVDLEPLIGFFINTLPIRTRFTPPQSFRQLLQQVKATSLAAYDHQELPFEQMVDALNVPRDTSRNPLVQVMMQLIEFPEPSLQGLEELESDRLTSRQYAARFDLEVSLRRNEHAGLTGEVVYATELFDRDRIERMGTHLLTLLTSALEAPDAPAASLRLLPDAERLLIESWQQGPIVDVPDLGVHQLFERHVNSRPDAIALIFEDEQLSYTELNARADNLAQHLTDLGVGPEVIVAVCLERSVELIVCLLAILKAGGAYLPLDPGWPDERQRLLLQDAGCTVLLNHHGSVILDTRAPARRVVGGSPLAYVAYTSGSTGRPKGVAVTHHSILRLVDSVNGFQLDAGSVVLQFAPVAFDLATFEIWGPLLNGGTVAVAPPGQQSLSALAQFLRRRKITTAWLTAGLFHAMVDAELQTLAGVRQVLAGGEALSPQHVQRLLDAFPPGHELINGYGPTESTTFTSCLRMDPAETVNPYTVPIGRPIALTEVRVLDRTAHPCPIGVPGELHIGGDGLARGYLNNPELTAQVFIPEPFSTESPARLYKSGDLASWNPDGTLAFHGRVDQQIKLRGFRIEPGEIEANLLTHPGVAQAAVVLRDDDPAHPRLIAYWVAKQDADHSSTAEQLRGFLAERLPDHMVPTAFIQLETLPLNANGKLDRRALPAPSFSTASDQRVAPTSDAERRLHAIWAEVLGHSDFGITDNFFAVGGNSLMTMKVHDLVRERFEVDVPGYFFFLHPTIQEFLGRPTDGAPSSTLLEESADGPGSVKAGVPLPPPIERVLAQQHAYLSMWPGQLAHGHQFVRMLGDSGYPYRLFWCFQGSNEHEALAQYLSPGVRVYGMRSLYGTDDAETVYGNPDLLKIVAELYAREVMDLADTGEPLTVGGNCQSARVAIAVARHLADCGFTVGRLLLMELRMQEIEEGTLDWDGPVTLIWGADSHHNPFSAACTPSAMSFRVLKEREPAIYNSLIRAGLHKAFTGGLDISVIRGIHGAFFQSENIESLAAVVKKCVVASAS